jgi:DNA modification methylase
MQLDQILTGNAAEVLSTFDADLFHLTVTSPPYDDLRNYQGPVFDWDTFTAIAKQLYRVTAPGGVVVWIVGDATINGSESLTSFNQALYFRKAGFNLHDTMIWNKYLPGNMGKRYVHAFEYMFIFSKGEPRTFNPLLRKNITYGQRGASSRKKEGAKTSTKRLVVVKGSLSIRENVWRIPVGGGRTATDGTKYAAPFPEALARDHILSWSNESDIVLDPLCGSGTTCKMAKMLNRRYVGIDISNAAAQIAARRLEMTPTQFENFV